MSFEEKIQQIEQLQLDIQKHGQLPEDIVKRINYKFRLEWNYYSNKLEGNSLTRQETRTVMVGNITVEGKPIKDVMDMKGHDDVITSIIKMGKGELNISEKRIKEIHSSIMYEEDPEKRKLIGLWKKDPNFLYNYKNERFDFVAPNEVPDRMHILINWLNTEKEKIQRREKGALHPIQLAFQFHLEYITIHPFFDGNGRTARIFTNLILISYGYPPLYIKDEEKNIYYQYLADIQGYGGNPDLFYDFMAGLLIRSMQIVINAIEGKIIDEPEDLDKKIYLLEKELEAIDPEKELKIYFSKKVFLGIYDLWLAALIEEALSKIQKFNKFFLRTNHHVDISGKGFESVSFIDEDPKYITSLLINKVINNKDLINNNNVSLRLQTIYDAFKKGGLRTFKCICGFEVRFDDTKYELFLDEFIPAPQGGGWTQKRFLERLLHIPLSKTEIDLVTNILAERIFQFIDFNTKQQGLR